MTKFMRMQVGIAGGLGHRALRAYCRHDALWSVVIKAIPCDEREEMT